MPYHFEFKNDYEKHKYLLSLKQNFLHYLDSFPINELKLFLYKIEQQILELDKNVDKDN